MDPRLLISCILLGITYQTFSQNSIQTKRKAQGNTKQNGKATSGNPVFPGWYADPEGIIFGKQYWIYPTYSAPFDEQVFMDAFSSPDLVNWTKHSRILDTT